MRPLLYTETVACSPWQFWLCKGRDGAIEERSNAIMAADIDFLLSFFSLALTPQDCTEVGPNGFRGVGPQH